MLPFSLTTASDQGVELGEEASKTHASLSPCSHSVENKGSFLRGSSDLFSAGSLCLRDGGWQGTVFIRQLCRREMVQTSSCYRPPRLLSLKRGGRSNPHPRQLESINSLYIPTAACPPSHSLGEEQGILIISVIQMQQLALIKLLDVYNHSTCI